MKYGKLTEQQILFIKDNYNTMKLNDLSTFLNISKMTIYRCAKRINVAPDFKGRNHIDELKDKKFNKLTILYEVEKSPTGKRRIATVCDCNPNVIKIIELQNILSGSTKSCGCYNLQCMQRRGKDSPTYTGCDFISGKYWSTVKRGARKRSLEFSITIEYARNLFLKQNRKCALSGIELIFPTSSTTYNGTASFDRINSDLGYIEGNCQWVHKDINIMKMHFQEDYFIDICHKIAEIHPKR